MKKLTFIPLLLLFCIGVNAQNNCQCSEQLIKNENYKASLELGDAVATDIAEVCDDLKRNKNMDQLREKLDNLRYAMDNSDKKETDPQLYEAFNREYKSLKACIGDKWKELPPAKETETVKQAIKPSKPIYKVDIEKDLTVEQKAEAASLAAIKTRKFNDYLTSLMVDKLTDSKAKIVISNAILLFSSPSCQIEISNILNGKESRIKRKIDLYLNSVYLSNLKFDVQVEYSEYVVLPNSFYRINNNYYCTVSYKQMFKKFKDGKLIYADNTIKNITVKFNFNSVTDSTGQETSSINLFLQNASVKETQKLKE